MTAQWQNNTCRSHSDGKKVQEVETKVVKSEKQKVRVSGILSLNKNIPEIIFNKSGKSGFD